MLTAEQLIQRCHQFAQSEPDELNADSLIGFFQVFRPDGMRLAGLYDELPAGDQLHARLDELYAATGDDRRPSGGRDAYFIVRDPPPLDPAEAESLATAWLSGLLRLAELLGDDVLPGTLNPLPTVRVLEGLAPKHPKSDAEKSRLLKSLNNQAAMLLERADDSQPHGAVLRQAYYFVAGDTMLRDYLMWPLYESALQSNSPAGVADPFAPYFRLWACGVKYRIFGNSQVDLYLPRQQG